MSFPACLPEIAVSWPWTFSWQGRCHSFLQNYHNCKTWVIKSWFFFSTRNKMNLLYSTLKKVPILITDQGHWGEQSRWWRWSTESGTQYPIHGPGPTGKNKGTGNSKLDKWTKSMDRNVTYYDTIESETTGTCYSEHREHQIQVLLRWYARWEKTTENCVIWFIQGLTRYIPVTTKTQLSGNVSVCTPLHLTCSEYRPSTHPDADSLRVNLIVMGHL